MYIFCTDYINLSCALKFDRACAIVHMVYPAYPGFMVRRLYFICTVSQLGDLLGEGKLEVKLFFTKIDRSMLLNRLM